MATKPVGIGKPDGGKTFDLSPLNAKIAYPIWNGR